jgi:hypothetical protein
VVYAFTLSILSDGAALGGAGDAGVVFNMANAVGAMLELDEARRVGAHTEAVWGRGGLW